MTPSSSTGTAHSLRSTRSSSPVPKDVRGVSRPPAVRYAVRRICTLWSVRRRRGSHAQDRRARRPHRAASRCGASRSRSGPDVIVAHRLAQERPGRIRVPARHRSGSRAGGRSLVGPALGGDRGPARLWSRTSGAIPYRWLSLAPLRASIPEPEPRFLRWRRARDHSPGEDATSTGPSTRSSSSSWTSTGDTSGTSVWSGSSTSANA